MNWYHCATMTWLLSLSLLAPARTAASDWNQLGGAGRDYRVDSLSLATSWPEEGPREVWRVPLGAGYSGIAAVGDRLFTMYREDETEITVALSAADGARLWERRDAAPFAPYHRMEHGSGPHLTPLVVDGVVFTAGIHGNLMALDAATGELRWRRELIREMGGSEMDRGYSSSPIAHGDHLIAVVGGEGQGLVAFRRADGEPVWRSLDLEASYSSPLLIEIGGREQLVLFGREAVVAVDPNDGSELWRHGHPTSYGLNISVPLWNADEDRLFVSSAYNGGSRVLALENGERGTTVEEVWAHKQMRIHIGNAVRFGEVVWGANGDFGAVPFTGVRADTGEIVHRTREIARAYALRVGDLLLALDEDGVLTLARPRSDTLDILEQRPILQSRTWTPPTVAGARLYARDQDTLVALELPKR